ncbi:RNA-binding riboflavin kinase RibR [compost metagenome]
MKKNFNADVQEWPDLAFQNYCLKLYRLNRGTYNTIDQWLFMNGFSEIKRRRLMLLQFLDNVSRYEQASDHKYLSFGKGKLIVELLRFVKEREAPVLVNL